MRAILIPVKEFCHAKKRLAQHLSPADRATLAQAMCDDFFKVVAAVHGVDRVFVISKEPWALSRAQDLGWQTIVESRQISESDSVDAASHSCAQQGVRALLRVPIDIPLAEPEDIEAIFEALEDKPTAILIPSRDGTGTNALLRSPPELFPSHFGPNSFARHLAEAERCGASARILRNPRIEFDVDELEDFREIASLLRPDSATTRWFSARSFLLSGVDPMK